MERLSKILENRHDYAREWKKRTGGKVVGYFEPYFPEELAYAFGVLPVRIMARHEADDITDRQMYGNCYPSRDMLNQFVLGRYDYIDGIVYTEGCQWMFNTFQTIVNNNPGMFNHYLFVPDFPEGNKSKDVLRTELSVFSNVLATLTGRTITNEDIDKAIEICNTNRRLLRRIYELRRADRLVVSGSESMDALLASQVMDKVDANALLEDILVKLEEREPYPDGIRLMLIGSETWDASVEKLVESIGAHIVIDELDNGSSYIWNEVIPQKDRLMAISLRYLGRPHCALKDSAWRRRLDHIFRLYEDFQAEGVIIAKQIYCHPHGTAMYAISKMLRERNIPYHVFERDTTLPEQETRMRMESFISMVKPGITRLAGWNKITQFNGHECPAMKTSCGGRCNEC